MPSALGNLRDYLGDGWQLCATPMNAVRDPAHLHTSDVHWLPTALPCTAASALRAQGHWSLDGAPRDFDAEDWWFRLRFSAQPVAQGEQLYLAFGGIATLAQVWLNGALLFQSDNMFVAHRLRIDDQLDDQLHVVNELTICCRALTGSLAVRRARPKWRTPMIEQQQLRWLRTTLLGRTPGWSPPAAAVGPWRPIWIERSQTQRPQLNNVRLITRVDDTCGVLQFQGDLEGEAFDSSVLELVVQRKGCEFTAPLARTADTAHVTAQLTIPNVDLWWPHTHGDPALYEVQLRVRSAKQHDASPADDQTIAIGRIGFRTLVLDTSNNRFALSINGVAVFCRGACWTPLDVVSLSSTADAYRAAIAQAQTAGMNMLRVGGTMVYESREFLDACDAQGMLVWHDFMFANMDYPVDDANFRASALAEVEQALAQWMGHPSIAIVCGNSEGAQQAAMWGADRSRWQPEFFHATLAEKTAEWLPATPYWPSSAWGGEFPHQVNAGTASYYGVGAYLRPLQDARTADVQFASECLGFANVPESATIAAMPGGQSLRVHHANWKQRTPRDLGAGWDFDDVRDHYLAQLFKVEPLQLRYTDHERYLLLSRIATGEVMAATFAHWRHSRSTCGGALIWFLRDLWPGAGWGVIDSTGVAKAALHRVRQVLAPIALTATDEGGSGVVVHALNDTALPISGQLSVTLYRLGDVEVARAMCPLIVPARGCIEMPLARMFDHFIDLSYAYRFGPATFEVLVARWSDQAVVFGEAHYFPLGLSAQQERDVGLSARAYRVDDSVQVTITTQRFAQFVHIDCDGYVAAEQYFHLSPGSTRTVQLRALSGNSTAGGVQGRVIASNAHMTAQFGLQP